METAAPAVNRDRYNASQWQSILISVSMILFRQGGQARDKDVSRLLHYLGYETEDEFCQARGFTDLLDAFTRKGWFQDIEDFIEEIQPDTGPLLPGLFLWQRNTLLMAYPPKQTKFRDRYFEEGEQARQEVQTWLED